MDVAQALSDLTEISSQVTAAAVVDEKGKVLGSTSGGDRLADAASRLLEEAGRARPGREPVQLEAATHTGSVFVLRDGARTIIATTGPEPTVGLVFYDLKSCLKAIDEKPKRKRAPRKKKEDDDGAA